MLPSHMQHPFVDRYRDSHNASPRSMTDEDTLNPPTSGKYQEYFIIVYFGWKWSRGFLGKPFKCSKSRTYYIFSTTKCTEVTKLNLIK